MNSFKRYVKGGTEQNEQMSVPNQDLLNMEQNDGNQKKGGYQIPGMTKDQTSTMKKSFFDKASFALPKPSLGGLGKAAANAARSTIMGTGKE